MSNYRLSVDFGDAKAGMIFYPATSDKYREMRALTTFDKQIVENNPALFQEIKDTEQDDHNSFTIVFSMLHSWNHNIDMLKSVMLRMGLKPDSPFTKDTEQSSRPFEWTDELVKDYCEFVGLRINTQTDFREQMKYLMTDFKKQKGTANDVLNSLGEKWKEGKQKFDPHMKFGPSDITDWDKQNAKELKSIISKSSEGKDWEIVAFEKDGHTWTHIFKDPILDVSQKDWESYNISNKRNIHSVKRLSDGEVFSVGRNYAADGTNAVKYPISAFRIDGSIMLVDMSANAGRGFTVELKQLKPPQQSKRIEIALINGFINNPKFRWVAHLYASHDVPLSKFNKIKIAIETIINDVPTKE